MDNVYKTIVVDGTSYIVDDIQYEYNQLDSESTGRSDDGTMYRDVVGLTNKIYCDFKDQNRLYGDLLSNILKELDKTSCTITYYDPKEKTQITKNMYITGDAVKIKVLNGEAVANPFQIRFIQMNTDDVR